MRICLNDLFYGHGRKLMQGHMAFESGIVSRNCKQQTDVLPGVETFGLCAVMIPCKDVSKMKMDWWWLFLATRMGGWDRSFESNSFLNGFSENTSGTSLFSRPRWVEVYNRGGCTLKHCWEKISDPSMERLRMDDERSLVSVWFFCGFLSANNEIRLIEPSVRVKVCIIPCGGYSWDLLTLCDKWFDHSKRLESKNWRSCLRKINASTAVQRQNFYNMFSINNANNIPKFGFTLESKHIL